MNQTITTTATAPCAFITKSKQRVKQFNETVYLQNGDEFEIELFNPTTNKVLAKIEINGNTIGGSGIVLRPGERVFLERYLNDAKKFLFETYKVSGNNSQVQEAIKNNGDIVVKFYSEYIPFNLNLRGTVTTWNQPIWYETTGGSGWGGSFTTTSTPISDTFTSTSNGQNLYYNSTSASVGSTSSLRSLKPQDFKSEVTMDGMLSENKPKEIETGRVEKGSNSDQSFTYDYSQFNSWHFTQSVWKILPASQKPIMKEDLVVYCGECGRKRKKESHKFCPHCGTKF